MASYTPSADRPADERPGTGRQQMSLPLLEEIGALDRRTQPVEERLANLTKPRH